VTERRSGSSALERLEDRVAVHLSTRLLAEFGEELLLGPPTEYQVQELLRRSRELVRLLEGRIRCGRLEARNLIDLDRRRRQRAIRAALDLPPSPRSPQPPAAQGKAHV
jgi:hypothetical protein